MKNKKIGQISDKEMKLLKRLDASTKRKTLGLGEKLTTGQISGRELNILKKLRASK
jgi:hypothetical protein